MMLQILSYIGGTGVVVALLAFLCRQLVLHRLAKDLETYRAALDAQREKQVEGLRHEFEKLALEHQVIFQKTYLQRHDALKTLHQSLRQCLDLCLDAVRPNGDKHVASAVEALDALRQELWACEIYLPRATCEEWASQINAMRNSVYSVQEAHGALQQDILRTGAGREYVKTAVDDHAKAWRALNEKLVEDIRKMIGGGR